MSLEWTVLGAGSILPRAGYGCSGYALRERGTDAITLFDCGPGSLRSLAASGLALADVERVVLSHFHPDHCLDVFALAFARRNPGFRSLARKRIELVGPRGLATWLERGGEIYGERSWLRFEDADVVEVDPSARGARLERGDLTLRWIATRHTPDAVAWRVDARDGASIAYTGDSGENADVAELARGVGLFACECSFPDDRAVEHHLTPTSAARLARASGCRRLLLTHFYPELDPQDAREVAARTFDGPIDLARDGSRHVVEP